MNSFLTFVERALPIIAILLSSFSAIVGYFALRQANKDLIALKGKLTPEGKSPVIEQHEELPGFQQRADLDDVD